MLKLLIILGILSLAHGNTTANTTPHGKTTQRASYGETEPTEQVNHKTRRSTNYDTRRIQISQEQLKKFNFPFDKVRDMYTGTMVVHSYMEIPQNDGKVLRMLEFTHFSKRKVPFSPLPTSPTQSVIRLMPGEVKLLLYNTRRTQDNRRRTDPYGVTRTLKFITTPPNKYWHYGPDQDPSDTRLQISQPGRRPSMDPNSPELADIPFKALEAAFPGSLEINKYNRTILPPNQIMREIEMSYYLDSPDTGPMDGMPVKIVTLFPGVKKRFKWYKTGKSDDNKVITRTIAMIHTLSEPIQTNETQNSPAKTEYIVPSIYTGRRTTLTVTSKEEGSSPMTAAYVQAAPDKQGLNIHKNQIRFPYGIGYKFNGHLHHNIDRVWVVTMIPLPDISLQEMQASMTIPEYDCYEKNVQIRVTTASLLLRQALRECSLATWKMKELEYKAGIHKQNLVELLQGDLPNALPDLYSPDPPVLGPPNRRKKRALFSAIAGGLITLASEVTSHFLKRKRDKAVTRAVQQLREEQNANLDRIRRLESDFIMYGKYSLNQTRQILHHIKEQDQELSNLNGKLNQINQWVHSESIRQKLDLSDLNAFDRYTNYTTNLDKFLALYEHKYIFQVERLVQSLKELLKGIATLSTGRLPPELLPHRKLADIIAEVKEMLRVQHSTYEVALPRVNQYYDMKLATFMVSPQDQALVITFPVLIKPITLRPIELYEIDTVHVPVWDQDLSANTYTRVQTLKPYIALDKEYYIQLTIPELRDCKVIDYTFFCEDIFLMKHKSKHTCESALYYNLDMATIKRNCKFDYFYNTTVVPSVLDGGHEIILANMLSEKKLNCREQHNLDIPLDMSTHSYVMVNRSILCNCKIEADYISVLSSLSACEEQRERPPLKFTVNQAYNLYIKELTEGYRKIKIPIKETEFLDTSTTNISLSQPTLPFAVPDIRNPDNNERPTTIDQLLADIDKVDIALQKQEVENKKIKLKEYPNDLKWLDSWQTGLLYFFSALFTILLIIAVAFLAMKYKDLRGLFFTVTHEHFPLKSRVNAEILQGPTLPLVQEQRCPLTSFAYLCIIIAASVIIYKIVRMIITKNFWRGTKHSDPGSIYLVISARDRFHSLKLCETQSGLFNCVYEAIEQVQIDISLKKSFFWDSLMLDWGDAELAYYCQNPKTRVPVALPKRLHVSLRDKLKVRSLLRYDNYWSFLIIEKGGLRYQIPVRMEERDHCKKCMIPFSMENMYEDVEPSGLIEENISYLVNQDLGPTRESRTLPKPPPLSQIKEEESPIDHEYTYPSDPSTPTSSIAQIYHHPPSESEVNSPPPRPPKSTKKLFRKISFATKSSK